MELRERFLRVFKQEHQDILDGLLNLREAIRAGDAGRAHELVEELDGLMGPHFRVEEEALYPMLESYLGRENVEGLLAEHEGAVAAMREMKSNVGEPVWLGENGQRVLQGLEGFFMHVTACDGLSIIVERFPDDQKLGLADALDRVQAEALPLTEWRPGPEEAN